MEMNASSTQLSQCHVAIDYRCLLIELIMFSSAIGSDDTCVSCL